MHRKYEPSSAPIACEFCTYRPCWIDVSRPSPNDCDNCGHPTVKHKRICEAAECLEIATVNEGLSWSWPAPHFCDQHKPTVFSPDPTRPRPDDEGVVTARRSN